MSEPNGSGVGLTVRDLVLEVRADVKVIDARVKNLEESKFILRGVWATMGVGAALITGLSGLVLAALAYV